MRVAILLKGYPRLSETFIAQELLGLQEGGLDFAIFSLRKPYDPEIHPIHRQITAPVHYLPEYLHQEPLRVLRAWWEVRRSPGYRRAKAQWLQDFRRDLTRNRARRFGQALVLAAELPQSCDWIYAHFLHTPASVGRYAALLRELPWSVSAHAKDIYTSPDWDLEGKLSEVDWLVTCTAANVSHLRALAPKSAAKVALLYHGLDLERFSTPPQPTALAQNNLEEEADRQTDRPVEILSVGRIVEKKGYPVLLEALDRLPDDLNWRFTHIGGGSRRKKLLALATRLGLAERCRWLGPKSQAEILAAYRASDIFTLASRVADDGDRDGLPNVLMEAQSQRLAIVSTAVSAIPELIVDGETGLLVPPGDAVRLALALERLIREPGKRARMAAAGERRVREKFSHEGGVARLLKLFADAGLESVKGYKSSPAITVAAADHVMEPADS